MPRPVILRFVGDASNLLGSFAEVAGAAEASQGVFKKIGGSIQSLGQSMEAVGKKMTLGVTLPLLLIGDQIFKRMSELDQLAGLTAATIKSTGDVSGVSAQHVLDMALAMQNLSGVSKLLVQGGENVLLTFTNIRNGAAGQPQIFDEATKAALGMSLALGIDMPTAALRLGQALNDPAAGISKLSRLGVQLTSQQADQVKALMQTGDVMGAQKVILDSLNTSFGQAAEAYGNTIPGKIGKLKQSFLDFGVQIMTLLLPALDSLMDLFQSFLGWLEKLSPSTQKWIAYIALAAAALGPILVILGPVITLFGALVAVLSLPLVAIIALVGGLVLLYKNFQGVRDAIDPVLDAFKEIWDALVNLFQAFQEGGIHSQEFRDALAQLGQSFVDLGSAVGEALLAGLGYIKDHLGEWAAAFWGWIETVTPPLLEKLGELLQALGSWLWDTALPVIAEHLGQWAMAFWAWLQVVGPPLLQALGDLLVQLGAWIVGTALPAIGAQLLTWVEAFWAWVVPATTNLIGKIPGLLLALTNWIVGTAAPAIIDKLGEWTAKFVAWVGLATGQLIGRIPSMLEALTNWLIGTAAPAIAAKLIEWTGKFGDWASDLAGKIPGLLIHALAALSTWFTGVASHIPEWLSGTLGAITAAGAKIASAFISGIVNGISSAGGQIRSAVSNLPIVGGAIASGLDVASAITSHIPGFADGGMVTSPTLAVVGEAGPELILPLNKPARMAEIMKQAGASAPSAAPDMSGGSGVQVTQYITAYDPRTAAISAMDEAYWAIKTDGR